MRTNDLKKGQRILLRNGWYATLEDNKRGNIRMATVEGLYTEMGSIYGHDILMWVDEERAEHRVEHTDTQKRVRAVNLSMFGG